MRFALIIGVLVLAIIAGFFWYKGGPDAQLLEVIPLDGEIDLAKAVPGNWERVYILAPYTTNSRAREILGVPVNVARRSNIGSSDSIALLVTIQDSQVKGLFEISFRRANFTPHAGECFPKNDARFLIQSTGHPYATHTPSTRQ